MMRLSSISSGPEMNGSPAKKRLEWSEIGVLTILVGLVVFGLAANGLSLLQSAVSLGVATGVLVIAWLWQWTLRRAATAPPPTWRRTAWDAGLFVAWLAVMAALAWWLYASDRSNNTRHEGESSVSFPNASEDQPEDDAQPEPPAPGPLPSKCFHHAREMTHAEKRSLVCGAVGMPWAVA